MYFVENNKLFVDCLKNDFYIRTLKKNIVMELYIIALVIYLVLFIVSTIASNNYKLKSLPNISFKNSSLDNELIKETIIVNPEIVATK